MPLNVPLFALALKRCADIRAHIRLGHPAVQNIDPLFRTVIDDGLDLLGAVPLEPFAAEADLADLQARFPKTSVTHTITFLFRLYGREPPPDIGQGSPFSRCG